MAGSNDTPKDRTIEQRHYLNFVRAHYARNLGYWQLVFDKPLKNQKKSLDIMVYTLIKQRFSF
jgi:hypothetical protein